MPFDSKFPASAYGWQREDATSFDQISNQDAKLRSHGYAKSAVRCHDDWERRAHIETLAPQQEHWNACSVFGFVSNSPVLVRIGVEWNCATSPRDQPS